MSFQICSCKGLNSECEKCFGSGYVNTPTLEKFSSNQKDKKSDKKSKVNTAYELPENIDSLQKTEIKNITFELIALLDLKSKKQMQILNSIPFSSTTFRRDFKEKFENLRILENEKIVLRDQIIVVNKNYAGTFNLRHFLSDKEIDVDSNRQLKDLIKEYKKFKN